MRKSRQDVEEDLGEVPLFGVEYRDNDVVFGGDPGAGEASRRHRPARQRLELRNEQKSLREQLSDWDDYSGFDTDL